MANITNTVTIYTSEYRPCLIKDKKALFHRWEDHSVIGGIIEGQTRSTYGIVEFESGEVKRVYPNNITFCDSRFEGYYFEGYHFDNDIERLTDDELFIICHDDILGERLTKLGLDKKIVTTLNACYRQQCREHME